MITLNIGKMEIDWGKNAAFRDHSALFRIQDIKPIPYYYVDMDTDKPIVEMKEGFSRKLSSIKRRLDLLGYDLPSVKRQYEDSQNEYEEFGCKTQFAFDDFYNTLRFIDLPQVDTEKSAVNCGKKKEHALGEYIRKCIQKDPNLKDRLSATDSDRNENDWRNPVNRLGEFVSLLDPYLILRILAENPNNSDLELYWNYLDVVENGWVKREEIVRSLSSNEKILIVTEGSSDSFIIKKAIESLYPDIEDFFDFIDMEEHYPFTGVGSLYNFCLGLARINICNRIMVVFDNDTVGNEKYELLSTINKPKTLLITKLPDFEEFSHFQTLGPQGETNENINGKAVSIECFLDFQSVDRVLSIAARCIPPVFAWV